MGGFLQDNFLGNSPHVCPSQVGNREDGTQAVCQVGTRGRAPPLQCCSASNRNYVLPMLFAKAHTCVSDSISHSKHLKDIIQPIVNRLPHLHSTLEHG